jgi:hypothetical protein
VVTTRNLHNEKVSTLYYKAWGKLIAVPALSLAISGLVFWSRFTNRVPLLQEYIYVYNIKVYKICVYIHIHDSWHCWVQFLLSMVTLVTYQQVRNNSRFKKMITFLKTT